MGARRRRNIKPIAEWAWSVWQLAHPLPCPATDDLDSVDNVTAQQLSLPYGGSRYSNGTMPTSTGYTGQRADAATGLDYYGARYYDPVLGQFTSADDVLPGDGLDPWGLSRYAYVEGNPIARNDPSGHCFPICAFAAAGGAILGAAIGVAAAAASGQPVTLGTIAHIAADAALGATAGVALTSGNPGAIVGAATAATAVVAGMVATHPQLNADSLQDAFEAVALGTDAGFVGDAFVNPAIAAAGNAPAQLLTAGVLNTGVIHGDRCYRTRSSYVR